MSAIVVHVVEVAVGPRRQVDGVADPRAEDLDGRGSGAPWLPAGDDRQLRA